MLPENSHGITIRLTTLATSLDNGKMINRLSVFLLVASSSIFWQACENDEGIRETEPLTVGSVTARLVSSFSIDDFQLDINLPNGLEVRVLNGENTPIADALVSVYPSGGEPLELAHQGNGAYRVDVLSGRLEDVESEYFVEVESEALLPSRFVFRVPHEPITERPLIVAPSDRSEQTVGQNLIIRWEPVPGASCYDVGVRSHPLEPWTIREDCLIDTIAAVEADDARDFGYILVRAENENGDPEQTALPYYSRSYTEAEVRIFFVSPETEE
jgi:hypothetical protein